jgi:hypothetical protein
MTKSQLKPRGIPSGVFLQGTDLSEYAQQRGDLRALFDRVHTYFFENPGVSDPLHEIRHTTAGHRSRKGGPHAHGHSR